MAHECPDCYEACYCHGDIDDMVMDGTREEAMCDHCPMDGDDDPDFRDCLDCGMCDWCIERSIAYAKEMAANEER